MPSSGAHEGTPRRTARQSISNSSLHGGSKGYISGKQPRLSLDGIINRERKSSLAREGERESLASGNSSAPFVTTKTAEVLFDDSNAPGLGGYLQNKEPQDWMVFWELAYLLDGVRHRVDESLE
ncbi:hypothetical protein CISG_07657 [Coccidioides immitis RMSCC 3703]|uniref:Uncharacterized protein n=2 Tax=Coccidioides immitis TaxID=5501 RepID=A0A0J8R3C0_COCIT|nr:hypothetical protein CIRG_02843 [Coccidioides immitis RMSCC 2394]KMU79226.1 hypothetical protein CISG_07657 [Coccidioides immitis RMSCC 3703]